jgi:hypothetical protein
MNDDEVIVEGLDSSNVIVEDVDHGGEEAPVVEEKDQDDDQCTDNEGSVPEQCNDPPRDKIDNMSTAREIDIKVRPIKRFNYPDNWFQRETRSQRQQTNMYSRINPILSKRPENPRVILTPKKDCIEALSEDNDYRDDLRDAINKEMGTIINMQVLFEYITP